MSYWGATVGANIAEGIPMIGGFMKTMMLAGETYNDHTLPRFYIIHAAVLPGIVTLLLILHIAILRIQGVSELRFENEPKETPTHFDFFPDHLLTEILIGLILMVILSVLACLFPAMIGPKVNPMVTPEVIKPEWYFYVTFRWLKLFAGTVAILSMGFIVFIIFSWPWIDGLIRKKWPKSEASVWIGMGGMCLIIGLTLWEALVPH
jgi:quinol-cytochrome oxidoreductase complex cytochrome b subunit